MAIESIPRNPLQPNYHPANGTPYHVRDGDSWASLARRAGVDAGTLIEFNFHTRNPNEVNWYLRRNVGCRRTTADGRNYIFSTDAAPGIVYLPPRGGTSLPSYTVPNVNLIPQDNNNACWYASAMMVVNWRRNAEQQSRMDLLSPSEVPQIEAVHRANNGLLWAEMRRFAAQLGLTPLPLMTPTPETLVTWLRTYGPIWTDGVPVDSNGTIVGTGHVVVLAGIRPASGGSEHFELLIYDPWPPNQGDVRWRPASHLAIIESGVADNPNRNVSFLVAQSR
ncbi:MAG TPA: papain-like cysteine protease family protein [Bryobacteraceae bacterium]|nr:papain-like cysteine protease family protein [Bryobacteraceae bacterium]